MNRNKLFASIALVLIGIVFGVVLVSGFGYVKNGHSSAQIGANNPLVAVNADAQKLSEAFIEVSKAVTPTVVSIEVSGEKKVDIPDDHRDFFKDFPFFRDLPKSQPQRGSGSGVIISNDGYIMTNNHVVEGAKSISVTLTDKRKFNAELIGTDPLTDLAVVKIDAKDLTPAFLGNSDKIQVGQWVLAIGNPLGLNYTVTAGIISAMGRGGLQLIQDSYGYGIEDFIQTDAAINPGNSGGALVDLNGAVIGINSAIASRTGYYQGYGFAIPINIAKTVAKDLIEYGSVKRGYIGVQIRAVDDAVAKSVGLDKTKGVIVESLIEDGAAKDAGIEVGDIIVSIDGREVYQPNDLQGYIASKHAGDKVQLKLWRDGKNLDKTISLRPRKEDKNIAATDKKKEDRKLDASLETKTYKELGLTVKNLSSNDLKSYKVENGVLISGVDNYGAAFEAGLRSGLVVTEINKKKVDSVKEFDDLVNSKKGSALLLRVRDAQGNVRFVGLEIPK
ncbi:MAG: Do family serine endopeptidase [Bacteroidetes bacterium]|nr:Do family serine endopeptidase [Bacteroidota bacterium]